jgi:hypothetical protein
MAKGERAGEARLPRPWRKTQETAMNRQFSRVESDDF